MSRPLILSGVIVVLAVTGCAQPPSGQETLQIANPASVHCGELGGRSEMRTDASGGQYAMCHLPDGTVCEEWALFRKECP